MTLVILGPIALLHKFSADVLHFMQPLGAWGVAGLALLDSAMIPIPGSMDSVIMLFIHLVPKRAVLYCIVAAAASAIGSLVPFYIGRAGGELFLLKRINRERYERMRDRFERQEFIAILIPSMGPPPTPLKMFQFAAGVFEMKTLPFMLATFAGKLAQYLIVAALYIWFGEAIFHQVGHVLHRHLGLVIGFALGGLLLLVYYFVRKTFDRKKGIPLPVEEIEP